MFSSRHRRDDGRSRRHPPGGDRRPRSGAPESDRARSAASSPTSSTSSRGITSATYGWDGAPIHDAVAVAHVIRPGARRDAAPQRRGRARVGALPRADRRRPLAPHRPAPERARGVGLDTDAFFELLVERIGCVWDSLRPWPTSIVFVEVPSGSRNKYELDAETRAHRPRPPALHLDGYPADYGFIEGTMGGDGDPLDALSSSASRRSRAAGSAPASSACSTWPTRRARTRRSSASR